MKLDASKCEECRRDLEDLKAYYGENSPEELKKELAEFGRKLEEACPSKSDRKGEVGFWGAVVLSVLGGIWWCLKRG